MKIPTPLAFVVSIAIVAFSGCNLNETVAPLAATEWRSENFDVSADLGDGWQKSHGARPAIHLIGQETFCKHS